MTLDVTRGGSYSYVASLWTRCGTRRVRRFGGPPSTPNSPRPARRRPDAKERSVSRSNLVRLRGPPWSGVVVPSLPAGRGRAGLRGGGGRAATVDFSQHRQPGFVRQRDQLRRRDVRPRCRDRRGGPVGGLRRHGRDLDRPSRSTRRSTRRAPARSRSSFGAADGVGQRRRPRVQPGFGGQPVGVGILPAGRRRRGGTSGCTTGSGRGWGGT